MTPESNFRLFLAWKVWKASFSSLNQDSRFVNFHWMIPDVSRKRKIELKLFVRTRDRQLVRIVTLARVTFTSRLSHTSSWFNPPWLLWFIVAPYSRDVSVGVARFVPARTINLKIELFASPIFTLCQTVFFLFLRSSRSALQIQALFHCHTSLLKLFYFPFDGASSYLCRSGASV